jgi:hypothetical protein
MRTHVESFPEAREQAAVADLYRSARDSLLAEAEQARNELLDAARVLGDSTPFGPVPSYRALGELGAAAEEFRSAENRLLVAETRYSDALEALEARLIEIEEGK